MRGVLITAAQSKPCRHVLDVPWYLPCTLSRTHAYVFTNQSMVHGHLQTKEHVLHGELPCAQPLPTMCIQQDVARLHHTNSSACSTDSAPQFSSQRPSFPHAFHTDSQVDQPRAACWQALDCCRVLCCMHAC